MNAQWSSSLRFGWLALAIFIAGGLLLESLHLFKSAFYFEVSIRRDLWVLAHAHGALLAIVNIIFGLTAIQLQWGAAARWPAVALKVAAVLVPAGFLLGGIGNSESDPSLWILLTPVGAVAALAAAIRCGQLAISGENPVTPVPGKQKGRR